MKSTFNHGELREVGEIKQSGLIKSTRTVRDGHIQVLKLTGKAGKKEIGQPRSWYPINFKYSLNIDAAQDKRQTSKEFLNKCKCLNCGKFSSRSHWFPPSQRPSRLLNHGELCEAGEIKQSGSIQFTSTIVAGRIRVLKSAGQCHTFKKSIRYSQNVKFRTMATMSMDPATHIWKPLTIVRWWQPTVVNLHSELLGAIQSRSSKAGRCFQDGI